jgi:glutathione S-transferase
MSLYKLTYFNNKARAELIRYIFAYANVEYEDYRIEYSSWDKVKPTIESTLPFGQVPILEVKEKDGEAFILAQSITIGNLIDSHRRHTELSWIINLNYFLFKFYQARFLARRYGLVGKTERENIETDMYVDQITYIFETMILARFEREEKKRKELIDKLLTAVLPKNMNAFEEKLKTNKGHLVSNGLTYADLYLFTILEWWFSQDLDTFLLNYPHFKYLVKEIIENPNIAKYRLSRPVTEF